MRNIFKKTAAAILALAMCLNFAGCYSEDKTWAAKKGDNVLPIGGYIYYLANAYSEAAADISSDTEVLKGQVDGENATDWIKNRAMDHLYSYYYINDMFDKLKLELTQEELDTADSNTASIWTYSSGSFEPMGIAQTSLHQAYTLYNAKYQKVLMSMYSEGGELALSDDELKSYYVDNYYSYEYFYVTLTKTDEDGNSTALTDDEKTELKKTLTGYVDQINSGELTVSEASTAYSEKGEVSPSYADPTSSRIDNLTTAISEALEGTDEGKATFAETTSGYYVIKKLPIADAFTSVIDDEEQKLNLLLDMNSEDFTDYAIEHGKGITDIEINQKAIDSISVSSVVTDSNKNGTSSASSEVEDTDSSASSDTSSDVSSQVSSSPESGEDE